MVIFKFFLPHKNALVATCILVVILVCVGSISNLLIRKIGRRRHINEARISLICRYISVSLFLLGILIEAFILGAKFEDIAVIFSSVFAILGIALFAVWSILSNVTSGIIMFFNFPYKIGDKIEIHDKDFPIKAIIEDIRAFQLHLRLDNGDLVTYPNNFLLQKAVTLVEKDALDTEFDDEGSGAT
jgi:small-conductance mechanosensitive channel